MGHANFVLATSVKEIQENEDRRASNSFTNKPNFDMNYLTHSSKHREEPRGIAIMVNYMGIYMLMRYETSFVAPVTTLISDA